MGFDGVHIYIANYHNTLTVSYTHLDVYKRQMKFWGEHRHVMAPTPFPESAWQCTKRGAINAYKYVGGEIETDIFPGVPYFVSENYTMKKKYSSGVR